MVISSNLHKKFLLTKEIKSVVSQVKPFLTRGKA